MADLVNRIVYGWLLIFIASTTVIGISLLYSGENIFVPRLRATFGVVVLLVAIAITLVPRRSGIIVEGLAAGFFLMILSVMFQWAHPMYRYAAVRQVNSEGYITSDEVYLRSAPVVRRLEVRGSRTSADGSWFGVERYLYSPRIGMVLGKSLGESSGSPDMDYELYGLAAWLFGIRAACEEFAFFVVNLTPILLLHALYKRHRGRPSGELPLIVSRRALLLALPFGVGLLPLIKG